MPRNYVSEEYTNEKLKELKRVCHRSSRVNAWYDYGSEGSVRGPWNRWFLCQKGSDDAPESVASVKDDVTFASKAMNHFENLIDEVLRLREQVQTLTRSQND